MLIYPYKFDMILTAELTRTVFFENAYFQTKIKQMANHSYIDHYAKWNLYLKQTFKKRIPAVCFRNFSIYNETFKNK